MLKSVHYKALAVWTIYTIVTKGSFLAGLTKTITGVNAYLLNVFLGLLFGSLFLYFFSHEDFFKFAREIERKNVKKEKRWEHFFLHFGKLLSAILITVLGGPLIGALAIRFLLHNYKHKYLIIILSSAVGAALWLGVAKGAIILRLPF
jgi:hypothetical protein